MRTTVSQVEYICKVYKNIYVFIFTCTYEMVLSFLYSNRTTLINDVENK